jgi:hypothetical protein
MKIVLTNDEWAKANVFHKAVAVLIGNAMLFLILGGIVLLIVGLFGIVLSIPIKIYLVVGIAVLLLIFFRMRRRQTHQ